MQIWLNDERYTPVAATELQALVAELSLPAEAVAMAINGEIIPRSQWSQTPLTDEVKISLFQAIAGG